MTTYPDLKNEPELLKIKTKDDEIKNLKYETEILKYQTENIIDYNRNLSWRCFDSELFDYGTDQSWCGYNYFI